MIFSGRHYSALIRLYSETFEPIPDELLDKAGRNGQAPALLDAMFEATKHGKPIQNWTPFEQPRFASRAPTQRVA